MKVDRIRLERFQDERHCVEISTSEIYFIKDLQIVNEEVWIVSNTKVFKDTDVLTLEEHSRAEREFIKLRSNGIY
tara:strand:+ start:1388 stop:1612 length:225 start_codon:yes stop_codon:yes gene_type:complete